MEDTSSRRRFFRRATIAALIGTLAAGVGAKAWAHGGPGGWHRGGGFMGGPMDPAAMDERIERMVKHFAVEVDATPEQRAKLTEIAKAAAKDLRPMREKVQDARRRGIELLAAPTIDRAAIERLRAEQIQAADVASRRLSQALADSAEVLTAEQRKQLAERFQRRHGRRRG
ncbi:MAG TPA: Spy/CpxP family protein refolding chaperone [Burkholderiales bacterium]|nr:Spy/CpxP family protein refolding chaperone [Burkholderiales bacterium]